MTKKNVTIDDLAMMVSKGFDEMGTRFDMVEERLDRIEKIILIDHRTRIEKLEAKVEIFRDALALK